MDVRQVARDLDPGSFRASALTIEHHATSWMS
jgi:hypothetical protein